MLRYNRTGARDGRIPYELQYKGIGRNVKDIGINVLLMGASICQDGTMPF